MMAIDVHTTFRQHLPKSFRRIYIGVSEAKNERQAFTIAVQRRFRNGWMVAANYTYSKLMDSCSYGDNGQCATGYGELRVWTDENGTPVSEINRWGRGGQDRPHVAVVFQRFSRQHLAHRQQARQQ